jgi:hypothetical protein
MADAPVPRKVDDQAPLLVMVWLAAGIFLGLKCLIVGFDADVWWHLAVGRWITDHGALPTTDPFSRLGLEQGRPWVAYSWLYELVIFRLYQSFGLAGIVLYRLALVLLIVIAFAQLQLRREWRVAPGFIPAFLAVLTLLPLTTERPWLVTILGTVLTLQAMLALRDGSATWRTWCLPMLFVLWANVHIQFVYGMFVLGAGCIAPVIDRCTACAAADDCTSFNSVGWRRLILLSVLCGLATLVTPFGIGLYKVMWEYMSQPVAFNLVYELTAPNFRDLWDWALLALTCGAFYEVGRRGQRSALSLLLLAGATYCAFHARRDMWFLSAVAIGVLASLAPSRPVKPTIPPAFLGLGAMAAVLLAMFVAAQRIDNEQCQRQVAQDYPAEAVDFIRMNAPPGRIYNTFDWGGYVIWSLPDRPVSIDGRTNLYGEAHLQREAATRAALPGWQDDPDLKVASVVLLPVNSALAAALRTDVKFRAAYEDQLAIVFYRQP